MNHRLDPSLHDEVIQPVDVGQVADHQTLGRNGRTVALTQVVVDPDVMPAAKKQPHRMAADVAGAACNKYSHFRFQIADFRLQIAGKSEICNLKSEI